MTMIRRCLRCQKSCLKSTLSQGNWYLQAQSEFSGFQATFLFLLTITAGWTSVPCMNVNSPSLPLVHLQYPWARTCVQTRSPWSGSVCDPKLSSAPPPLRVLLSGLPRRQTLWKPEQARPRRAWLNVYGNDVNALRLEMITYLLPLSSASWTRLFFLFDLVGWSRPASG